MCSAPNFLGDERRNQHESSDCCHSGQTRGLGAQVSDCEQQVNEIARYSSHQNTFQHQVQADLAWNQTFADGMMIPVVADGLNTVFRPYAHDSVPNCCRSSFCCSASC